MFLIHDMRGMIMVSFTDLKFLGPSYQIRSDPIQSWSQWMKTMRQSRRFCQPWIHKPIFINYVLAGRSPGSMEVLFV